MNWYQQLKGMYLNQIQVQTRTGVAADCATQHLVQMFRISGGNALLIAIFGHVVAAKAVGAQTIELGHTPTSGIGRQIFSIASPTTASDAVGSIYTWNGIIGGQLLVQQTGTVLGFGTIASNLNGALVNIKNAFVPGVIDFTTGAANDLTGLINWYILYKPLSVATRVVAV